MTHPTHATHTTTMNFTKYASVIATGAILVLAQVGFALLNNATKPAVSPGKAPTPESVVVAAPSPGKAPTPESVVVAAPSVERYACEQATKMQLRDPDSYQKIAFEAVGDGSAALNFRSRNGFGGYTDAAAVCTVEGTGVRSIIVGQNP